MHANLYEPIRKWISEQLNTKITFDQVANEVLLMEMGHEPLDPVIRKWIGAALDEIKAAQEVKEDV
jgi:hypothetical protein